VPPPPFCTMFPFIMNFVAALRTASGATPESGDSRPPKRRLSDSGDETRVERKRKRKKPQTCLLDVFGGGRFGAEFALKVAIMLPVEDACAGLMCASRQTRTSVMRGRGLLLKLPRGHHRSMWRDACTNQLLQASNGRVLAEMLLCLQNPVRKHGSVRQRVILQVMRWINGPRRQGTPQLEKVLNQLVDRHRSGLPMSEFMEFRATYTTAGERQFDVCAYCFGEGRLNISNTVGCSSCGVDREPTLTTIGFNKDKLVCRPLDLEIVKRWIHDIKGKPFCDIHPNDHTDAANEAIRHVRALFDAGGKILNLAQLLKSNEFTVSTTSRGRPALPRFQECWNLCLYCGYHRGPGYTCDANDVGDQRKRWNLGGGDCGRCSTYMENWANLRDKKHCPQCIAEM